MTLEVGTDNFFSASFKLKTLSVRVTTFYACESRTLSHCKQTEMKIFIHHKW